MGQRVFVSSKHKVKRLTHCARICETLIMCNARIFAARAGSPLDLIRIGLEIEEKCYLVEQRLIYGS